MSSSDLDIETISQIFPLSDSESSENLLATGAGEDQTPESGPEIETEQEQAMTEKSADVSLKPSDIVKTSDDAEEGLCDQEAKEDSSSAVQTPESGPGTEQEQAMVNFKTEKSADVSLKPSDIVKASDGAEAEEDSSLAVQTPEEETKSLRRENKDLSNRHMWWRQKM